MQLNRRTACAGKAVLALWSLETARIFDALRNGVGVHQDANSPVQTRVRHVACRSHSRKFAAFYRFNVASAGAREEKTS